MTRHELMQYLMSAEITFDDGDVAMKGSYGYRFQRDHFRRENGSLFIYRWVIDPETGEVFRWNLNHYQYGWTPVKGKLRDMLLTAVRLRI